MIFLLESSSCLTSLTSGLTRSLVIVAFTFKSSLVLSHKSSNASASTYIYAVSGSKLSDENFIVTSFPSIVTLSAVFLLEVW
ncbi:hypothetical protein [Clostridium brassicae]|uniref:Uncharacterized protein n=1 Tax=Clostridium brassicae TaxID=2999072 RepID=A0ABT4DAL0_9CLOT|nr:hypothetical protein [Clostridium brassicae]MCY6959355.1 hypothetical protein [Clostridium brassicae]